MIFFFYLDSNPCLITNQATLAPKSKKTDIFFFFTRIYEHLAINLNQYTSTWEQFWLQNNPKWIQGLLVFR